MAHIPTFHSFLCLSQESSATKSLGAKESFTAQTRRGWIPVTSTGMRERFVLPSKQKGRPEPWTPTPSNAPKPLSMARCMDLCGMIQRTSMSPEVPNISMIFPNRRA
ncbi:hypothetical protein CPJ18_05080 [Agrobacterium rosae]|uniref:Uncharacterized protein n=1 Tax=Agrobacterium rosae TaxID=1972867 RepID=A0AAE5S121_9HYPH|nr:hypothetical protein CPJ18_05080 [Agrobacterium rosae]